MEIGKHNEANVLNYDDIQIVEDIDVGDDHDKELPTIDIHFSNTYSMIRYLSFEEHIQFTNILTDINKHWARPRVDEGLRAACRATGIEGVSTHSFRRSALTLASSAGVPTRTIQLLSGHSSLEQLQRYIDVSDEQKLQAANAFG